MGAGPSRERMLYESVRTGNLHLIRYLIDEGASPNWMNSAGKTPLILACSAADRFPLARTLIESGADVNYPFPESSKGTALLKAAKRGLDQTVILLLSHGANPLLPDKNRRNALECARNEGHTGIVRAIENKICFFSDWLRDKSGRRIWAVVLPSDNTLFGNVPELLKIALYSHPECPRPFKVVSLKKFSVQEPDFLLPDPELVLSRKSTGAKLKLLSGEEGDKEQLRLLCDICVGETKANRPSSGAAARATPPPWAPSSLMAASGPLTSREETDLAMAIYASYQTAEQEGIPLPGITWPATITVARGLAAGEGTSGLSSSCIVCSDAPADTVCVPCGHLGCMPCLTEVRMRDFGCPVCRAPIERIMRIYPP